MAYQKLSSSTTSETLNSLKKEPPNHLLSPPHLYSNHHASDVYLSFQFPIVKKTDNEQLSRSTGTIRAILEKYLEQTVNIIRHNHKKKLVYTTDYHLQ